MPRPRPRTVVLLTALMGALAAAAWFRQQAFARNIAEFHDRYDAPRPSAGAAAG